MVKYKSRQTAIMPLSGIMAKYKKDNIDRDSLRDDEFSLFNILEPYKRCQLEPPKTLIKEFKDIHNYLAGNASGITREASVASELIKIIHCKTYDEFSKKPQEAVDFWFGKGDTYSSTAKRIRSLFESVKAQEPEIFISDEQIKLDDKSICYIVKIIQMFEISGSSRDVLGEAFETIIGPALRGGEGQFFTPRNLARFAVEIVNPKPSEKIIDPACGAGGFLIETFRYSSNGSKSHLSTENRACSTEKIIGVDKDCFLAKIAQAQLKLNGCDSKVFCENSLARPDEWDKKTNEYVALDKFDIVITNPPFGARIPVEGVKLLDQYDLAREWKSRKINDKIDYTITADLKLTEAPQILFIERCLDLLKEGGRMAIVLPEGILGNANSGFVRKFIRENAEVIAIIDCPLETFLPSTPTKTCLLILKKAKNPQQREVFMAIAEKCGHDRRGKPICRDNGSLDDDFPDILVKFNEFRREHNVAF